MNNRAFMDPLWEPIYNSKYRVDIRWFEEIHCRRPLYQCINFYEYFILDENNDIIDSIKLYPKNMGDLIVETDKETYDKIKRYIK